jgi:hypothetical protein
VKAAPAAENGALPPFTTLFKVRLRHKSNFFKIRVTI